MKPDKQRLADYKAERKAMKAEIKAQQKVASKAKKSIRKNTKLISNTERELGHWYYQEQKRSTAEGSRKLKHCCTRIQTAEKEILSGTEQQELALLRVKALKQDLKDKKNALKNPEVTDVII